MTIALRDIEVGGSDIMRRETGGVCNFDVEWRGQGVDVTLREKFGCLSEDGFGGHSGYSFDLVKRYRAVYHVSGLLVEEFGGWELMKRKVWTEYKVGAMWVFETKDMLLRYRGRREFIGIDNLMGFGVYCEWCHIASVCRFVEVEGDECRGWVRVQESDIDSHTSE
ncbi:hypothetical protein Tco_0492244 [Tanacetum coccineum]